MRWLAVPLGVLAFHGSITPLPDGLRAALAGKEWHAGCPTALSQLREVTVTYRGFDGRDHGGVLVVNQDAAAKMVMVFRQLYALHFPLRRMLPVGNHTDNTSAFECRLAKPSPCPGSASTGHWSEHAYGEAVDLDPTENPYTGCGVTRDPASLPYLDRSNVRPGMVTPAVVAAFRSVGWGWGGDWTGVKDYMHFSATGH